MVLGIFILSAAYIISRLPTFVFHGKSPYEAKNPYSTFEGHTSPVLCLNMYIHDNFQSKSVVVALMGYNEQI